MSKLKQDHFRLVAAGGMSVAAFLAMVFLIGPWVAILILYKSNQSNKEVVQVLRMEASEVARMKEEARKEMTDADATMKSAQKSLAEARQILESTRVTVQKSKDETRIVIQAASSITNLWVNDTFQNILDKLNATNYETQKTRLEKTFEACRSFGIHFDSRQTKNFFDKLKNAWTDEKAIQRAKDEQDRIREVMREEQRAEKARQSELKRLESESRELEKRRKENEERLKMLRELESLKQLTEDQRKELDSVSEENTDLVLQLEEKERRKSMAEMTRAGHVYVISNVGSFGENVFKVGMTRRLIPEDRVKELGDASVPFPFDIHMMVATEDAPALEYKLHEELWDKRLNLVNDRREFFNADLASIKTLVDKHGGGVLYEFKEHAQASQYRESDKRRKAHEFGEYTPSVEATDEDDEAIAS